MSLLTRVLRSSIPITRTPITSTLSHTTSVAVARPVLSASTLLSRSYHERVIDHYENPRNVGSLPKGDRDVGTGLVGAPACGDVMKLQMRVNEAGVITEAVFKTFGCG